MTLEHVTASNCRTPALPPTDTTSDCANCNQHYEGGVVFVMHSGSITVRNSSLIGNKAYSGGALWAGPESSTLIERCEFRQNDAVKDGGAVNNKRLGPSFTVRDSKFVSNFAGDGGGIYVESVPSIITNSIFRYNEARVGSGDGIRTSPDASLTASKLTMEYNKVPLKALCIL